MGHFAFVKMQVRSHHISGMYWQTKHQAFG
jgi:hypothetical protein